MTLEEIIEGTNKYIAENTKIKDGRADNRNDFFVSREVKDKIVERMGGHGLTRYLPLRIDRGNIIHLGEAGITLFLKRKCVVVGNSLPLSTFMSVEKIEIKEDKNSLAGETLDVILGFIQDTIVEEYESQQIKYAKEIKEFDSSLDDAGITMQQFFALWVQYAKLSPSVRRYFERIGVSP